MIFTYDTEDQEKYFDVVLRGHFRYFDCICKGSAFKTRKRNTSGKAFTQLKERKKKIQREIIVKSDYER